MTADILFVLMRSMERLIIVVIGGVSLWMGWQLFLRMQLEEQQAEVTWNNVSVKLQRVGPGIFFAAFGTILLGIFAWNLPSLTPATGQQPTIRMIEDTEGTKALDSKIVALNITINIADSPSETPITPGIRDALHKRRQDIVVIRNDLLRQRFTEQKVATWLRWREELRTGGKSIPSDAIATVREVETLAISMN
jgi:hypothetical protein